MKKVILYLLVVVGMITWGCSEAEEEQTASYVVETIPLPPGLEGETGAIDFLSDGRLVACFLRGEVMIYDPKSGIWDLFASGLHEPLGLLAISPSELLVMQRPELTRIMDTDGDGKADFFETVTDDFGMTGNYHEWNYGPVRDRQGNLYMALSTASEYGHIMQEVRGKLDTVLVPGRLKQKFSAVPYRGWIMKLTPEGEVLPFASGFRSPNGILVDNQDRLFSIDNQGDWVGTSKLFQVEKNKFYGHPASLLWTNGWDRGDPSKLPLKELNEMRTRAAVLFPYGIIAASPTQPVIDNTNGHFGPFSDQLFLGEMNQGRIIRVMLEEVQGQLQGACLPFLDGKGLRRGNNRLAFAPDGSLWVGQAEYNFVGAKGIQRISFTGKPPMDIVQMTLDPRGFSLSFTQPVDVGPASIANNYQFKRYFYEYHQKYGSDQHDLQAVPVETVTVSPQGEKVSITLPEIKANYIYELTLTNIQSALGDSLENTLICYTVNQLRPPVD